jgi:hypothetical protein
MSSELMGGVLVRTSNNDKYVDVESYLKLTLGESAIVSVCCDGDMKNVPAWLSDGTWTISASLVTITGDSSKSLRVYEKRFEAGDVVLGGNRCGGACKADVQYLVIVKPDKAMQAAAGKLQNEIVETAVFDDGPVMPYEWVNKGDSDGDGLVDTFEAAQGLNAENIDTFDDGVVDESRVVGDGRTMWEVQEGIPAVADSNTTDNTTPDVQPDNSAATGGSGGGGCFVRTATIDIRL